jgi:ABC-type transport system substrate-binding protein
MKKRIKWSMTLLSLLVLGALILTSCAQPTPETIVETVTVIETVETIVEGETVVETVEVVQTVEVQVTPEAPVAEEGPLMADAMLECLPLPEMAAAGSGSAFAKLAPSAVSDAPSAPVAAPVLSPAQQAAGQVYRVGVFEDVTTINFWAGNGPDNTVWNSYMDPGRPTLYGLTDKYFTFVPEAAADFPEPLTQEGDFWVVEIPLRSDIVWSDGNAFTAEDVAFTAQATLDLGLISGNWSNWYDANFLDRMEAVDANTVKIYYHTKPGLARHEWGTLQAPILSKAYWEPVVNEAKAPIDALGDSPADDALLAAQAEAQDVLFAHDPAGEPYAGAFTFTRWETGAFVENTANADFFGGGVNVEQYANGAYADSEGLTVGTPEGAVETTYTVGPNVESAVYTVYGSQDAAILALKDGEVDFVLNPLGLQRGLAQQVETDPNLSVIANNVNGFRYLSFNNRRRPMNDCSFRQAVAVLIDKEFVTGTILQGVAFPLYTFVPEGNKAWFSDEAPKLGQGLSREERTNLAVAILEQAGYSWEGDVKPTWDPDNRQVVAGGRLIMPDGTPVPELNMLAPSPGYDPLRSTFAIWIETWLNEFGIPVTAELAGFNVIVPLIFTEQDFDFYILGWSLGLFPDYLRDFFAEEQAVQDGNNAGGYINPEFEALAGQILSCETNEECKVLADEIQILLGTETPYVLLFDTGIIEAYRSASVEFPFTDALSGLQYSHQLATAGLAAKVAVK